MRQCDQCAATYRPWRAWSRFCSDSCRARHHDELRRSANFEVTGRRTSWAPRCPVYFRTCQACTVLFSSRVHHARVCPNCRPAHRKIHDRERNAAFQNAHGMARSTAIARSNPDYAERRRVENAARMKAKGWTEQRRANAKARRARELGLAHEKVRPIEIYERDQWRCGLCSKRIDRRRSYPDPLSATIDHLVPLAAGGIHTRANLQAAHLRCNVAKGARPNNAQIRMV